MFFPDRKRRRSEQSLGRRQFLKLGAFATLATLSPRWGFAALDNSHIFEKSIAFYNTHTRESLKTVYWARGKYIPKGLTDINHILRDHRSGEVKSIDPRLLDVLHALQLKLKTQKPFHVISGYRSPKTNEKLRKLGRGVARHSLHIYGKAVDVRLPGCRLSSLRRAAIDLGGGGVGYYPRPKFVHLDIGRVRYW
ncbi:MAG: DUF882 domain-containing protein [Proteobacteria bacterium]|nr:DUF882 domain-containing protein [Pseudomonadota bacterium]